LSADEELLLEVQKKDGEIWEVEIEKDEYEDPGLEFENPLIDEEKSCRNKCVFCFIDQLPENMRETLYFKDDDSRLSFLSGNYVTLTNMDMNEIERVIKYKMSPINVSVHTTNPELRVFMLKNRFAGDILEKIKVLHLLANQ
jgi:NifB/MoaA-like Fe-S oxidoreductase